MAKKPAKPVVNKYKNLGGKSDVTSYIIRKDAVTIRFSDHSVYIYNNQVTGQENVGKMKTLAVAGKGLGTFINSTVKDNFARKIR
jgi:hypothetical protein